MGKSVGPPNIVNILISPSYRQSDWQLACTTNDWDTMVKIFEDRIESRLLKPIRLIASDCEIGEFSGFSILALDCLIIETLNQFYTGSDETTGMHKKAFWNFFKRSEFFNKYFSKQIAFTFYNHYRCGILHQAQTKNKSLVRINQSSMVRLIENDISKSLIIDRIKFHQALENEISSYIEKIKVGGYANIELRNNFVKKLNFICG